MIGYACLIEADARLKYKTLRLKNLEEQSFKDIIDHNLDILEKMIRYNIKNDIKVFRISSDIIPLASHKHNKFDWKKYSEKRFSYIGTLIKENNINVSMHPGQYTIINSKSYEVVNNSIKELEYHSAVLDLLKTNISSKMILHIGGVYGNKDLAIERFITNYKKLSKKVKDRLVIENDDRSFNISDVLYISKKTQAPVVFDNLHHKINPPKEEKSIYEWIKLAGETWNTKQKIHYSEQRKNARAGSHSYTIGHKEFMNFYNGLEDKDIFIMLEVKDKNLSCLKINNIIKEVKINQIEKSWAIYKYYVLSKDQNIYKEIRELLKDKYNFNKFKYYDLIEEALELPFNEKNDKNALEHVFGYFKDVISEKEKKMYLRVKHKKKFLLKMAVKYNIDYIIKSLYMY